MLKSMKKIKVSVATISNSGGNTKVKVSKERFDSIPPETWLLAFSYLSRKDHLRLLYVSSFFRQLAEQYVYERIVADFGHDRLRSIACLQSIKSRPQAAAAVRWLDITVPRTGARDIAFLLDLIRDVLATVEKLHLLRLYGEEVVLPKEFKKGCLQYLKAYRGAPGSLEDRGELPAVVELGYFGEFKGLTTWEGWEQDDEINSFLAGKVMLFPKRASPSMSFWPNTIRGLPSNFPNLKTLSLGSFQQITDDHIDPLMEILPVIPLERLDLVNFTPFPVSEELALVHRAHASCPTLRSVRLSSYNGDWRYLPQYEVWTTEDYDRRKLENEARAKQPMASRGQFTLSDTVKHLWQAAEVKLRFPRQ